jgi:hypothetical protein
VRGGTLHDPSSVAPDVHIYTSTKLPWVRLPEGARAFAELYNVPEVWSAQARARAKALRGAGEI